MKLTMIQPLKLTLASGFAVLSLAIAGCGSGGDSDSEDHSHDHPATEEGASASAPDDGYPLTTCIVSDEPLGSMGPAVSLEHEGVTVKFCCDGCIEDFLENPELYLPKLTQASEG